MKYHDWTFDVSINVMPWTKRRSIHSVNFGKTSRFNQVICTW